MKKGKKLVITLCTIIFTCLLLSFALIGMGMASARSGIPNDVYINNIDVGGLTKEEAVNLLNEKFNNNLKTKEINLVFENKNYDISYGSLNANYDVTEAVDKAVEYGKNESLIKRVFQKWNLYSNKYDIKLNFNYNVGLIQSQVEKIAKSIDITPVNAILKFDGKKFNVIPDTEGKSVDKKQLNALIDAAVKSGNETSISIPVNKVDAKVKKELLDKVNTRLASFTTHFNASEVERTTNLKIATQTVNGYLLMPNDIFSMNKALGPRTEAKGYKNALIIVGGKVEPGLAGGICQVTSTVYNAALLANMEITERQPHGLVVSYVAPGRDATISGDYIDLKFKNTDSCPIYIESYIKNSSLTVNFYGDREYANQRVEISSEVYERIKPNIEYVNDDNMTKGQEKVLEKPITGTRSKTYRKVYVNGKLVKNEIISQDTYKAIDGKTAVGTKLVNNPPAKSSETSSKDTKTQPPPNNPVPPPTSDSTDQAITQ